MLLGSQGVGGDRAFLQSGHSFKRSATLPPLNGRDLEKKLPLNWKEGQVLGADMGSWACLPTVLLPRPPGYQRPLIEAHLQAIGKELCEM